jgi:hypothetical protein
MVTRDKWFEIEYSPVGDKDLDPWYSYSCLTFDTLAEAQEKIAFIGMHPDQSLRIVEMPSRMVVI